MAELGAGNGSSYPTSLDTNSTLEVDSPATGKTKVRAAVPNDLAAAVIAVQTELGIDPAGTKTDVKTFLQIDHQTDGRHFHLITKSSGYTTVASDNWGSFRVDTSGGDITIALLAAATAGDGTVYTFTNTGSNTLTIDPNASETIAGAATITLTQNNSNVLYCDGANWHLLAGSSSIELVNDLTPQLGGDLDVNGKDIVGGSGDIVLDGQKWPQADGTANYVLKTDGSGQLSWTASGTLIKAVYSTANAVATTSTSMPVDNTIPQSDEGAQFMSAAITPTSSSNILVIEHFGLYSDSGTGGPVVALFQDSTAGALAATRHSVNHANGAKTMNLTHVMVAGTTSSTTFKIRAGSGNTLTFCGSSGTNEFGTCVKGSLVVWEYTP